MNEFPIIGMFLKIGMRFLIEFSLKSKIHHIINIKS